ncbi:MAG: O-antigen ligase family protein [Lachnospiraceae bacterium]|nr:O-antigen ligase family protein [Lachnospiraceae bacterium]
MVDRKKGSPAETGEPAKYMMIWTVGIYVFLMMTVYPLYYKNGYYDICDAKWDFFKYVSAVFAAAVIMLFIWYLGSFLAEKKAAEFLSNAYKSTNVTDRFAFAYLVVCCISSVITPYRQNVIWGYYGWYMGLIAQISFVVIYFLVSRFWRWDTINLLLFLLASFAVFFLGVIMRFRIDPLDLHAGLDEYSISYFISTLGQATWYSSYMCIVMPLGLVAYWCAEKLWARIAFGIFCAMSFMTAVTQNSDSAYPAMFCMFFILFWISFDSDEKFLRAVECVIIALCSFKAIGFIQTVCADRAVMPDALSVFMSRSRTTTVMLVLAAVSYLLMRFVVFKRTGFHIASVKRLRTVMLIGVAAGAVLTVLYMILNSTGKLPERYSLSAGYLNFNDTWGNNRGVSWRCSMEAFMKGSIVRKLFGAGPDCFAEYVYEDYRVDFANILGGHIVQTCAHNEWINSLINVGLFGLTAYFGTFISSFRDCMRHAEDRPYLYGVAMAIAAYILHNSFCYQQIICTPVIFILMGMAQSVIRFGYERRQGRERLI